MSLDVGYSYCINLTEEEKLDIDKQVRKNRFELKFAVFLPFSLPFPTIPLPQVPFFPVEGFSPIQIVRNGRDRMDQAVAEKRDQLLSPLYAVGDAYDDACEKFEVIDEMSNSLSKVAKAVRKDDETSKSLDKLETDLKTGDFQSGRGSNKLEGTKSVYYMRAGNKGRLFFRYSNEERGGNRKNR